VQLVERMAAVEADAAAALDRAAASEAEATRLEAALAEEARKLRAAREAAAAAEAKAEAAAADAAIAALAAEVKAAEAKATDEERSAAAAMAGEAWAKKERQEQRRRVAAGDETSVVVELANEQIAEAKAALYGQGGGPGGGGVIARTGARTWKELDHGAWVQELAVLGIDPSEVFSSEDGQTARTPENQPGGVSMASGGGRFAEPAVSAGAAPSAADVAKTDAAAENEVIFFDGGSRAEGSCAMAGDGAVFQFGSAAGEVFGASVAFQSGSATGEVFGAGAAFQSGSPAGEVFGAGAALPTEAHVGAAASAAETASAAAAAAATVEEEGGGGGGGRRSRRRRGPRRRVETPSPWEAASDAGDSSSEAARPATAPPASSAGGVGFGGEFSGGGSGGAGALFSETLRPVTGGGLGPGGRLGRSNSQCGGVGGGEARDQSPAAARRRSKASSALPPHPAGAGRARDYAVLVDASSSMRLRDREFGAYAREAAIQTRWELARGALEVLVPQIVGKDSDGISLYFFSTGFQKFTHVASAEDVTLRFRESRPKGGTQLTEALEDKFLRPDNEGVPETVLVITDGAPEDRRSVESLLEQKAQGLKFDDDLRVVFVQVGHDVGATRWLSSLVDRLDIPAGVVTSTTAAELAASGLGLAQFVTKSVLPALAFIRAVGGSD